ncbi:P-loop containing nucleoside triphosphate hydrolase protein [Phyllosticta citrichinensis]|uniref:Kinesin-like protein n=1 Tax=Phyllosticta citrichinensis TaxID=1130410 RepID=A0ABR1XZ70_9PEZI
MRAFPNPSSLVPSKNKASGRTYMPVQQQDIQQLMPTTVPEPATKRQASGEIKSNIAPPRPVNSTVKATTATGVRSSKSSSVSAPSTRSRQNSTPSFASSYSHGARSTKDSRPHTSMSRHRSQTPANRPATSMDNNNSSSGGKRPQGTVPPSLSTYTASSSNPSTSKHSLRRARSQDSGMGQSFHTYDRSVSAHSFQQPHSGRLVKKASWDGSMGSMEPLRFAQAPGSFETIPEDPEPPATPSHIPRLQVQPVQHSGPFDSQSSAFSLEQSQALPFRSTSPSKTPKTSPCKDVTTPFLNKDSNLRAPLPAWDTKSRLDEMEALYGELRQQMTTTANERENIEEKIESHKAKSMSLSIMDIRCAVFELVSTRYMTTRKGLKLTLDFLIAVNELEAIRSQLSSKNDTIRNELESTRLKLSQTEVALESLKNSHSFELKDLRRQHEHDVKDMQFAHEREVTKLRLESDRKAEELQRSLNHQTKDVKNEYEERFASLKREMEAQLDQERQRRVKEVSELQTQADLHAQNAGVDMEKKDRELLDLRRETEQLKADIERKTALEKNLRDKLSESTANNMTLESANSAMRAKINFLESDSQAQSTAFAELHKRMQEAVDAAEETRAKLREEETLRRKLHNQVQELKGNIRVFCRVRPPAEIEAAEAAEIAYPDAGKDSKEVVLQGPEQRSAMGNVTRSTNPFSFDRVFGPKSQNGEVFEEISQLVQSALDGYNVCIFCYGQTGSGKTYTMSSPDGMIPLAVQQIYNTAQELEEKGWRYKMEGQFVEVYNEVLNDLLGSAEEFDKKKHEIRHDPQKKSTEITGVTSVPLDSPDKVQSMLSNASRNRSVAATMANSRSSRSHSVFILKLKGENSITGERSEGTLNLVDLAGSERLSHSGATGDRLKETQNINRSLSCLGDVIAALGSGKDGAHIPYRNSKLTYLLQYSLGGNSKTLMFVMISPLQAHLHETLTSLKFATKVHNTHIGTAKRQAKVKE